MGQGHRTVSWTPSARDCLDDAIGFVAKDSPEAAAKVLEVVLAAVESLELFAERGRTVPEFDLPSIREIFVYRLRVIYQVSAAEVRVLAILHGAMDFEGHIARTGRTRRASGARAKTRKRRGSV